MPLLDKLREQYGVGPVCSELHIAPSTYYHCQQQRHHPDKRSARAQHDDWLKREIQRVYDENHQVYGVRKVWRQLLREGIRVARCTVARLMAVMGLTGVLRGKKVRTTVSRKAVAAGDRVNRQFVAERPDQLWVADFTWVSTWQGFVYVAFIIDVFAGYIVGWRVSSSMETAFVLDALEQALWARRPSGTIHHSDKGSQYVSLAYTQRLKEAGLLASTGSTGDSYDNAMAESINGLYKAEVIHRKRWKNRAEVELATLTWVDWYNNRRLLEGWAILLRQKQKKLIMLPSETMIWQPEFTDKTLSRKPGAVQSDYELEPQSASCAKSAEPDVRSYSTKSGLGGGPDVCCHTGGMVVPRWHQRCLYVRNCRLRHGRAHDKRADR
ncbi:integrase core domain protein [Escherichia coli 5.0959]|nr:integrase core domain protein [Escherichia coli 5.0959]